MPIVLVLLRISWMVVVLKDFFTTVITKHLPKIVVAMSVVIVFIILFVLAHGGSPAEEVETNSLLEYSTARILRVVADNTVADPYWQGRDDVRRGTITFEIEVLSGTFAGETLEAHYHMSSPVNVNFEVGDRVSARIFEFQGEIRMTEIRYPERTGLLIGAIIVFLVFLCIVGGKRGVLATAGLIFTVACVMLLLIPLINQGYPVVLMTLIILSLVTVATITLLAGMTVKGIAAILGSLSGVGLAAIFAMITSGLLNVSGYNMVNYRAVIHLSMGAQINGLFVSSVLVAAIGAIMDASMSVASAMNEVKLANPDINMRDLFKAGFNVSRDVMGTMSSTLILAFIGGSLAMMIFMYVTDVSFNQFINNNLIVMEVIKGIAGSFGIILAAPLTAVIAAKMLNKKTKEVNKHG